MRRLFLKRFQFGYGFVDRMDEEDIDRHSQPSPNSYGGQAPRMATGPLASIEASKKPSGEVSIRASRSIDPNGDPNPFASSRRSFGAMAGRPGVYS